jgi:hypothetical protein
MARIAVWKWSARSVSPAEYEDWIELAELIQKTRYVYKELRDSRYGGMRRLLSGISETSPPTLSLSPRDKKWPLFYLFEMLCMQYLALLSGVWHVLSTGALR